MDAKILSQYKPHDTVLKIHEEDPDLCTITIPLPSPPPLEKIDGYGLPAKEQKFQIQKMPQRLQKLVDENETIDEVWAAIENEQDEYKEEILWIKKQWKRRLYGYWFFNNGKPTYIDGWHYWYLNFFYLDVGLPRYRSRDRKFFIFARYCYTTMQALFKYRVWDAEQKDWRYTNDIKRYHAAQDEKIKCEEGEYLIDMGFRTVFGFNYPKHRRDGATYKCLAILLEIASRTMRGHFGIQSMDEASSEKYFLKMLIPAWKKLPFCFLPKHDGTSSPKEKLVFAAPTKRQGEKKGILNKEKELETSIDYATTADRSFYDGDKLLADLDDENGKTLLEKVDERWLVKKQCASQGNGAIIHGLSMHPSTVGEMNTKGGRNYFELCKDSMFEDRMENGQTRSGLINFFIPAYDGLEGFIDAYGESVIENPTKEQAQFIGRTIGAKEYIMGQRQAYLDQNTPESLSKYRELVRLFPVYFNECFRTEGQDVGFNLEIIEKRMDQLRFMKDATQTGNFKWENDQPDTRVIWEPCPEGRWKISLTLPYAESNLRYKDNGHYFPSKPKRFTGGADPFKFNKVQHSRMSKGGGAIFWNRDMVKDPDTKDIKEWVSHRFVCTYLNRPATKDEYAEDMLMMCVYYGALMYPEHNVPLIQEHFEKRKYGGFLKYDEDMVTGKVSVNPGFNTQTGSIKQDLFNVKRDYIEKHGMRERHIEVLEQCKDIKGIEDLTDFDLFTACSGALLGSESEYGSHIEENSTDNAVSIEDFFPRYRYAS